MEAVMGQMFFWKGEIAGHDIYIVPKGLQISIKPLEVPEGVSIRLPDSNPSFRKKGKARSEKQKSRPR